MATFLLFVYVDPINSPKTLSVTNFDFWANCKADNPDFYASTYAAYQRLASFEVEIPVPSFDPVQVQIQGLEDLLKKEMADSHARQVNYKEHIQTLKALGHDAPDAHKDFDDIPL